MAKKKKSRKATKAVKRRPAAKIRKTRKAKKAKKAVARKSPRRAAPKAAKRPARKARKDVIGEGNYTAAREFRQDEEAFVRANRSRIPEMGRQAEAALEGPEGGELRRAEDEARAHARD
ncbi:MAG TPA: hypothetical protein VLT91_08370 [Rhizomicrobium sp.]|nr:hypothetical protein [Rhizomicrobium sp.]